MTNGTYGIMDIGRMLRKRTALVHAPRTRPTAETDVLHQGRDELLRALVKCQKKERKQRSYLDEEMAAITAGLSLTCGVIANNKKRSGE